MVSPGILSCTVWCPWPERPCEVLASLILRLTLRRGIGEQAGQSVLASRIGADSVRIGSCLLPLTFLSSQQLCLPHLIVQLNAGSLLVLSTCPWPLQLLVIRSVGGGWVWTELLIMIKTAVMCDDLYHLAAVGCIAKCNRYVLAAWSLSRQQGLHGRLHMTL